MSGERYKIDEWLEARALKRLADGCARIPRTWRSVRTYEALVAKGLAVERKEANPHFRKFAKASPA